MPTNTGAGLLNTSGAPTAFSLLDRNDLVGPAVAASRDPPERFELRVIDPVADSHPAHTVHQYDFTDHQCCKRPWFSELDYSVRLALKLQGRFRDARTPDLLRCHHVKADLFCLAHVWGIRIGTLLHLHRHLFGDDIDYEITGLGNVRQRILCGRPCDGRQSPATEA